MVALIFVSHLYGVDYLPLISQPHNLSKIQNQMKFGIKCLQENAKERHNSKNYFVRYRNNTAAKTATKYVTTFIL